MAYAEDVCAAPPYGACNDGASAPDADDTMAGAQSIPLPEAGPVPLLPVLVAVGVAAPRAGNPSALIRPTAQAYASLAPFSRVANRAFNSSIVACNVATALST